GIVEPPKPRASNAYASQPAHASARITDPPPARRSHDADPPDPAPCVNTTAPVRFAGARTVIVNSLIEGSGPEIRRSSRASSPGEQAATSPSTTAAITTSS